MSRRRTFYKRGTCECCRFVTKIKRREYRDYNLPEPHLARVDLCDLCANIAGDPGNAPGSDRADDTHTLTLRAICHIGNAIMEAIRDSKT